ncbi:fimbrillin family protein [Parabacteroides sp. PF5-9]|uniref:fimbrillin family protein n=1 Tax=Parabacteroides sp. PF5-9 TaxID=1742404 RepID=UPI002476C0E6|nr:fimbrillin family protein [Parabacteroides sp. PF5-9]
MKKKYRIYYLFVLGIIAMACTKDDGIKDEPSAMEIRLSADVKGNTPTKGDEQILADQKVGVYISSEKDSLAMENNLAYTADGEGRLTTNKKVTYPEYFNVDGKTGVYISAYHPHLSNLEDAIYFQVRNDQSGEGYYQSDLLFSAPKLYPRQAAAHELVFIHQLTKITYSLKAGGDITNEDLKDAEISLIGLRDSIFFDHTTGVDTIQIQGDSIQIFTHKTDSAAIIIPQKVKQDVPFFKIELKSGKFENANAFVYGLMNKETHFEKGKMYHYDVTVNNTGIKFTTEVADWEDAWGDSGPHQGEGKQE